MNNRRCLMDDVADDRVLSELGMVANLVFDRLLTLTDDAGLCPGEPAVIKGRAFPLMADITPKSIEAAVDVLVQAGMLARAEWGGRVILAFKPESFQRIQSFRRDYKRKFTYGKLSEAVWKGDCSKFLFSKACPDSERESFDSRTDVGRESNGCRSTVERNPGNDFYSDSVSDSVSTTASVVRPPGGLADVSDPMPPPLDTPAFRAKWAEWVKYRIERRLPKYTPTSLAAAVKKLATFGESGAIASVDESIANNWQGLFEPKGGGGGKQGTFGSTRKPDRIAAADARREAESKDEFAGTKLLCRVISSATAGVTSGLAGAAGTGGVPSKGTGSGETPNGY